MDEKLKGFAALLQDSMNRKVAIFQGRQAGKSLALAMAQLWRPTRYQSGLGPDPDTLQNNSRGNTVTDQTNESKRVSIPDPDGKLVGIYGRNLMRGLYPSGYRNIKTMTEDIDYLLRVIYEARYGTLVTDEADSGT